MNVGRSYSAPSSMGNDIAGCTLDYSRKNYVCTKSTLDFDRQSLTFNLVTEPFSQNLEPSDSEAIHEMMTAGVNVVGLLVPAEPNARPRSSGTYHEMHY